MDNIHWISLDIWIISTGYLSHKLTNLQLPPSSLLEQWVIVIVWFYSVKLHGGQRKPEVISCFIALNGQFATIGSHEYSTGGDDDLSIAAEGERCEDHQHSPPRQHQHQHHHQHQHQHQHSPSRTSVASKHLLIEAKGQRVKRCSSWSRDVHDVSSSTIDEEKMRSKDKSEDEKVLSHQPFL